MYWIRRMDHKASVVALLIGVAVFTAVFGLRRAGGLQWVELLVYDLYLRARALEAPESRRVVTIGVTEDEIARLGWPLSDDILADILDRLIKLEPAAIGVDIYRDRPVGEGQQRLTELLKIREEIIWVSKFREGAWGGIAAPVILSATKRTGFSDFIADGDGVVRRGLLFLDDGQIVEHSFALRLALIYLAAHGVTTGPGADNPSHLALGPVTVPPFEMNDGGYVRADARGYQFLLDYRFHPDPVPPFSVSDVLAGYLRPEEIRDKVVILGVTAKSVNDYFLTPLNREIGSGKTLFGSALHGQIVAQLVRHGMDGVALTRTLSDGQEALWILFWALLGAALARLHDTPLRFTLILVGGVAALAVVGFVAFLVAWWIPVVSPALAAVAAAGLVTSAMFYRVRIERTNLMQLLSSHVSGRVAEQIWDRREVLTGEDRPEPQEMIATVLFTDIKGFTGISENMSDVQLLEWLNVYLERMAEVIRSHGGTIDRFIGDAVMAVFGVPLPQADDEAIAADARNAARCALTMARQLEHLNVDMRAQGLPAIGFRAGINSGPLVAGSVGSAERLEYTVMGDTVNTAARLESQAAKMLKGVGGKFPCEILVSEATLKWLGEEFVTQPVGPVTLKGKSEQVKVYHLSGFTSDRPDEEREL